MSSATFVGRFDPLAADAGKWSTVHGFGQLGFHRLGAGTSGTISATPETSLPAGMTLSAAMDPFCWQSPSTKPRATQRSSAPATSDLSTWYTATFGVFRVAPADPAKVYRLRLYSVGVGCDGSGVDNAGENRSQSVTIRDWSDWAGMGGSAPVLATSGVQTNFRDGMYLSFDVSGDVALVFFNEGTAPESANAVVSLFTWDDPPAVVAGLGPTIGHGSVLVRPASREVGRSLIRHVPRTN